jgi:hypothetical protein
MSELVLREFEGNTSNITNGVLKGSKVFIYINGNDNVDKANIDFIKEHIGASQEEYNLELTKNWTKNTGRGENTFIAEKLNELKTLNNELAKFILQYLDRIYWLQKGNDVRQTNFNTNGDNGNNIVVVCSGPEPRTDHYYIIQPLN